MRPCPDRQLRGAGNSADERQRVGGVGCEPFDPRRRQRGEVDLDPVGAIGAAEQDGTGSALARQQVPVATVGVVEGAVVLGGGEPQRAGRGHDVVASDPVDARHRLGDRRSRPGDATVARHDEQQARALVTLDRADADDQIAEPSDRFDGPEAGRRTELDCRLAPRRSTVSRPPDRRRRTLHGDDEAVRAGDGLADEAAACLVRKREPFPMLGVDRSPDRRARHPGRRVGVRSRPAGEVEGVRRCGEGSDLDRLVKTRRGHLRPCRAVRRSPDPGDEALDVRRHDHRRAPMHSETRHHHWRGHLGDDVTRHETVLR